ncbi:hypothetical protein ACH5RR_040364 [Cinchona calisaya]|uniref:Uncharacterized protein n=1 Tax=Cinchona calisaya TaxID=153742 RepID=A0ABD2XTQ6_9GENT
MEVVSSTIEGGVAAGENQKEGSGKEVIRVERELLECSGALVWKGVSSDTVKEGPIDGETDLILHEKKEGHNKDEILRIEDAIECRDQQKGTRR